MKKSLSVFLGVMFPVSFVMAETNYWEQSTFFKGEPRNYCGRYKPSVTTNTNFKKCFYIGAGYQFTNRVDPEPVTQGFFKSDDSDEGYNLYIGWYFKPHWFGEIMYADLGEATLSDAPSGGVNTASVSYQIPSIHLGYWLFESENRFNVYAKLGVSSISNDVIPPSISIENKDNVSLTGGVGVQWHSKNSGLFARLSADYYDEDTYALGLNVGYFLGRTEKYKKTFEKEKIIQVDKTIAAKVAVEQLKVESIEAPEIENVPTVLVAAKKIDDDNDGVRNEDDDCLTTRAGVTIDGKGCEIVNISLSGVRFRTNSADLTAYSKTILDKAAKTLVAVPEVNVEIQAHTCSLGVAAFNYTLSEKRAISVRDYLILKGVSSDRMRANGYGESKPIASNATKTGRHKNRRVELKVVK